MINKIYFRNAIGKLISLGIPEQAYNAVLHDLTNQQNLAAFISKHAGCAVMLPILATIK